MGRWIGSIGGFTTSPSHGAMKIFVARDVLPVVSHCPWQRGADKPSASVMQFVGTTGTIRRQRLRQ